MPVAVAPPPITFEADDCLLFKRYAQKVPWPAGVDLDDRERFKGIRRTLVDLFDWLVAGYGGQTELKPYASRVNPNAFSPPDLWGCAYPAAVGHQSYALQVALIIRRDGAELCFCLGAGWAQVNDPERRQKLEAAFNALRQRLGGIPADVVQVVSDAIDPGYSLRKRWRSEPGPSEFKELSEWLTYAGSADGAGASVSKYLTPQELEELGSGIAHEMANLLGEVQPLIDNVYAEAPPPIDPIEAALAKFEETVDEALLTKYREAWEAGHSAFEAAFGTEEKIAGLSTSEFFSFLNQIDSHTNAESGLFTLGPGTPAPKNENTESWKALEEDLPKLRQALNTLLHGEGSLRQRIDAILEAPRPRRYITEDLAVPGMLMTFANPAAHSGVNRMFLKEQTLSRIERLPDLPADASVGTKFEVWDKALRGLPAEYGRDWDWAKTYAFWWSDAFEEFFGSDGTDDTTAEAPDDAALVSLGSELHLSDDQFLVELREMLFQKGQLVLYGPPGTGKTFIARRLMAVLAPDRAHRRVVQFHPSYSYEDFVRGYRPLTDGASGLARAGGWPAVGAS